MNTAPKPCRICGGRKPKGARRHLCNFCRRTEAESHRVASARYYDRLKADPERYAAFLEAKRMQYRLRRERDGNPSRPVPAERYPKASKWWRLPAAPLRTPIASWLEENDATVSELAENARLDFMVVHRILAGTKDVVLVDTADRLLTAVGLHLDNVYELVPEHGTRAPVRSEALDANLGLGAAV
jgi:hypothetical protein